MQIYLARNNVQAGPYTLDQLNTMLASGEVILDDLMWHEGMPQWQRLGNITGNQYYYQPFQASPNHNQHIASPNNHINTNNTQQPNSTLKNEQRISIDKLYGRPDNSSPDNTNKEQNSSQNTTPIKHQAGDKTVTNTQGNTVVLAPISSRIAALAINGGLYLLSGLPLLLALSNHIAPKKLEKFNDVNAIYQYSQSLVESIPSSTVMLSQILMFGLFAIQLFLIITRGQSIGKAIVGIRVVDQQTHHLPSLGRLLGMRTLFLVIVYQLLFSIINIFSFIVIAANYLMASKSPENIGWHDKIAKTLVVKAEDEQLSKDSSS